MKTILNNYTGSNNATLARLYQATASLQTYTSSNDSVLQRIMQTTASLNIVTGSLARLYQATRSLELYTGSSIGIDNGLMAYTASLKAAAIVSSSTQIQNYDVFALNSNLYTSTGSLIGITNGLMAFTAALDSTYATDAQLYQLYAETASIKAEIGGIEAYTASLKGAAIVSSSQQVQNYFTFAKTGSANTFYGNQSISGSLGVNKSSNGGSGNDFPRLKVQNSLPTQGDGSTTFNFADILISSGNEAVNMFLATTYAAGTWAPTGIINVATNHGLQIKTNNTTALNIASGGDVTVSTGNLVIGTAGKGIDFSANTGGAGKSSQLLDDYEEGTITGTITCGTSGTVTLDAGYNTLSYTRILDNLDDQFKDGNTAMAICFLVEKEHRGKQIASALLEAAILYCQDFGYKKLISLVNRDNHKVSNFRCAANMYLDIGFEEYTDSLGNYYVVKKLERLL